MRISKSRAAAAALLAAAGITAAVAAGRRRRFPVDGKVVLITGGSRGLGLALAEVFGCAGARLVLTARDEAELRRAQALLVARGAAVHADSITVLPCDLTDAAATEQMVAQATSIMGRIDVLINNAGLITVGPAENQPLEAYREAMEINYFGMVHATLAVLPQMMTRAASGSLLAGKRPRRMRVNAGAIVNIASIGGKFAVPHLLPYTASKFAATGWSQGLRTELRRRGIRVTTVCPGLMRTGSPGKALFVGSREEEFRWFHLGASLPGLACSATHAANRILRAVETGEGELTITPQAAVAARLAQLMPSVTSALLTLANNLVLPEPVAENRLPLPGDLVSEKALRSLTAAGDRAAGVWNQ
jgi:short-subunit dehydrogenase